MPKIKKKTRKISELKVNILQITMMENSMELTITIEWLAITLIKQLRLSLLTH